MYIICSTQLLKYDLVLIEYFIHDNVTYCLYTYRYCMYINMCMQIFSSTKEARELWYTRGSDVILIGELELEFPEVGKSCRNREVEIQFDFSHTEIQVRILYCDSILL